MAESLAVATLPNIWTAIDSLIKHIEKAIADRAERKRLKNLEQSHQLHFFNAFRRASGPVYEDEGEAMTIRQYCRKLCDLIETHRKFLWRVRGEANAGPLGPYSMHAAQGLMATQFAILGLHPTSDPTSYNSLPPYSEATSSIPGMAGMKQFK
jgi:hypothetical protein